ncbi:MAG: sugar ABC transporter permease [Lachnospiraceae bacterium]|nr:sugar ABC transporter permease [Lachnospiraceae bacterium]MCI9012391.1 sugar ABC transporter permease [Lachnospiraceae bacterium]
MALWIDRRGGFFSYLIEMVGLIPWVISMVVAGLLWRWLFNGDLGLFNLILKGLGMEPIYVIQNRNSAIIALIFVMSWRTIGYSMVMLLAGLKGIDGTLLEAARVDGATFLQTLFRIRLPLIKSNLLLSTIVLTVSNFTNNTVPKVLTSGGPANATNVITLEQYNLSFVYYEFGRSSALSVLIMAVVVVIIACYIKVAKYEL